MCVELNSTKERTNRRIINEKTASNDSKNYILHIISQIYVKKSVGRLISGSGNQGTANM